MPASGKTTLARLLADPLDLPVLDKDDILESLFDSKGIGDAAWRRRLSRESDATLRERAESSWGAILVSFWHAPGMPADSGTPTDWIRHLSPVIVNVVCECPAATARARFDARRRHDGHLDGERPAEDRYFTPLPDDWTAIRDAPTVRVDTSQTLQVDRIAREALDAFARCHA